ncbi:hypothetical protein [Silvibacterium acidisoli]|uniref:hypothetical protein n=1 Tax=Acidobacteriaceae bacterium ZG23-2 TaxID=2883246 RepID=UPI00406CDA8A
MRTAFSLRKILMCALWIAFQHAAFAHTGPPFPILKDQPVGPAIVTVWANPDVGGGPFFVMLDPRDGKPVPADMKVRIGIQPVSGRLPEKVYDAPREVLAGQVQYKVVLPFDREERWHIHVLLSSATGGSGEAATDVDVTPTGYGRWDLMLYSLPFLAIGALWFKAVSNRRKDRKVSRPPS